MRAWVALAGLLLVSGCSSSSSSGDVTTEPTTTAPATTTTAPTTTSAATSSSTAPSSSSAPPPANEAPVPSIEADVLSGDAPLAVNFTLSATDADSDALTYNLTLGDGSAAMVGALPLSAPVLHTFASAGTYTVMLNVTDGEAFATQSQDIVVTEGTHEPVQSEDLEWVMGAPWVCGGYLGTESPARPVLQALNGIQLALVDVDPASIGQPFTAVFGTGGPDHRGDFPVAQERMWFSSAAQASLASFTADPGATVLGIVPAGATSLAFASCAATGNSVTYLAG